MYCGLVFAVVAGFGGFWAVPFLMKLYHVTLSQAADASAMIFIGAALGTPLVGWFSDYLQSRRVLMMTFAALDLVVMLWIITYPPAQIHTMFLLIAILGFFSAAYLLPFAVIRDITPSHMRGAAMGYINMMCIAIGSPIIQPLIGALLHYQSDSSWHSFQAPLFVLPICLLGALFFAYLVHEKDELMET
jgi:MFS family permease